MRMVFPFGPQEIAPVEHELIIRHNRAGNRNVKESWLIFGGDSIFGKMEQADGRWNILAMQDRLRLRQLCKTSRLHVTAKCYDVILCVISLKHWREKIRIGSDHRRWQRLNQMKLSFCLFVVSHDKLMEKLDLVDSFKFPSIVVCFLINNDQHLCVLTDFLKLYNG